MDLGCLDFVLSMTLVTNTALLDIVTNIRRYDMTEMKGCEYYGAL